MNDRLRGAIARINAGESRGTGALVARDIVLTALHVVGNRRSDPVEFYEGVTLTFPDHVTTGVPIEGQHSRTEDWVLLRIAEPPPGVLPVPLAELSESGAEWVTYGFPEAQPKDGMVQSGRVKNHLGRLGGVHAYQLFSQEAAAGNGAPVKGLSGGPVIVDGGLVGVMRFALMKDGQAVAGTLYACPSIVAAESAEDLLPIPDPCHGLPGLPHHPLPERPFRYLKWFTSDDAAIFFGRSREIRQMYDRLIDAEGASLILLYGQSGVGKSSFLDAGLVPRLGWTHDVFYVRRDPARTLLESVREELVRRASDEAGTVPPWSTLDELWRAAEERRGRPLVVFLDQVEEIYTRRRVGTEDEMAELSGALTGFNPRGKLVLGFRKEWFPEVHKQLEIAKLDFARVFLESLDRDAIVDAITGLTRTKRTRERYGLSIEESLPEMIARDLLADPDSPVAPTLQILLTKLWERATAVSATTPTFTVEQYLALRKEGTLLADFLVRQEARLGKTHPEAVESGLTLDILTRHTTHLLTSKQCDVSELTHDYEHVPAFDSILTSMRENFLLVDSGVDDAGKTRATRLAHDTLAPCVRAAFEESARPGQRARRVIDGRAGEWEGGAAGNPIDATDLGFVEAGLRGTRAPTEDEGRLLEASREARDRHEHLVRMAKGSLIVLAVALLIAVVWAWNEKRNAETSLGVAQRAELGTRLERTADSVRRLLSTRPTDGLLVALYAAGQSALDNDGEIPPPIQASLDRAMEIARESTIVTFEAVRDESKPAAPLERIPVWAIAHHPRLPRFLCGLDDGTLREFTTSARPVGRVRKAPDPDPSPIVAVEYVGDGSRVVSAGKDGVVRLWSDDEPNMSPLLELREEITALATANEGVWIAVGDMAGNVFLVDPGGERAQMKLARASGKGKGAVTAVAFTDEVPARVVTAYVDGEIVLWDVATGTSAAPVARWRPHEEGTAVLCVAVARDDDGQIRVVSGGEDETVRQVRLDDVMNPDAVAMREHDAPVRSIAFGRGGIVVASASDRLVVISNLRARVVAPPFTGPARQVTDIAYGANGLLVVASEDGTARVRDPDGAQRGAPLQQGEHPKIPSGDKAPVVSMAFSSDGQTLATSGMDGSLCIWDANGDRLHRETFAKKRSPTGGQIVPNYRGLHRAFRPESSADDVPSEGVLDLAFAHDDPTKLLLGCKDGRVRIWDVVNSRVSQILPAHAGSVTAVEVASGGRFATGDAEGHLQFWRGDGTEESGEIAAHDGEITDIAITPDGKFVVTVAEGDRTIKVWSRETERMVAGLSNDHQILSVAITHDGQRVISGSDDGFLMIRNLDGSSDHPPVVASVNWVNAIALSADQTRIVTGGDDGVARLWNAKLERLGSMGEPGHSDSILTVAIHGSTIASGGKDGETLLWRGSWREWYQTAVERLEHHPSFADPDPTFKEAVEAREFAAREVWRLGAR